MGYRLKIDEDYEFEVSKNDEGGFEVSLPHQCNKWKILGFEAGGDGIIRRGGEGEKEYEGWYPARPTNKEFAVKQMELFVRRAQEALEKLRTL